MLLNQLTPIWPPAVDHLSPAIAAGLNDRVISVQNKDGETMVVTLQKTKLNKYCVTLTIPKTIFQKILLAMISRSGMTLREIGELELGPFVPGQI